MSRTTTFALALLLASPAGPARAQAVVEIPALEGTLQLAGYWFAAGGDGAPLPAVIGLHGCSGALDAKGRLGAGWRRDARHYNAEGIHFLALDSFTPRGQRSICEFPVASRPVRVSDRRDDVFAAIQWLARQPGVDAARIVVHGRSHGGSTVLAALDRTDDAVRMQPRLPRAAVSLYPGCSEFARMWRYEIGAPLLLMIGEADDWTPAENCDWLVDKLRRAQPEADLGYVRYPGAHHGFDGTLPLRVRTGLATRSGTATVGGDPRARADAHARTFEFLARVLGQPLRLTHEARLALVP